MNASIRALREDMGWSQQHLADRAGLSRQLVSAVEAGRHAPNVHAGLALARALGVTAEDLFAAPRPNVVPMFGEVFAPNGSQACVTQVGNPLVVAGIEHGVANSEQWLLSDAAIHNGNIDLLDAAIIDGLLVSGCDPAAGMLAALVGRMSSHRVVTVHASTARSIAALEAGRVHAVLVHAQSGHLPVPPVAARRFHVARWQVGIASGRAKGVPSIDELAERRHSTVQREAGAGSQQALHRALQRVGAQPALPGPIGEGHIDVARRVAAGATAGVTMESAARAFALGFSPLEEHTVELWLDQQWSSLPAAIALIEALTSRALQSRLELVGGYDLSGCGVEQRAS